MCTELFAVGSICEIISDTPESISSDNNVTEAVTESWEKSVLNATLFVDQIGISLPRNDSVTNDTTISNATLIKKFTCLLEETPPEEHSTFQVCFHIFFIIMPTKNCIFLWIRWSMVQLCYLCWNKIKMSLHAPNQQHVTLWFSMHRGVHLVSRYKKLC